MELPSHLDGGNLMDCNHHRGVRLLPRCSMILVRLPAASMTSSEESKRVNVETDERRVFVHEAAEEEAKKKERRRKQ